jgi:hypothetical protein
MLNLFCWSFVGVGSTPVATGTAVFPSRNRSIIVDDV